MSRSDWVVWDGYCGLLYEDGRLTDVLRPGRHRYGARFDFDRTTRRLVFVDLRERSVTIKNQEILTADKVAVRLSLLVFLRVVDPKAAYQNVANFEERVYEDSSWPRGGSWRRGRSSRSSVTATRSRTRSGRTSGHRR